MSTSTVTTYKDLKAKVASPKVERIYLSGVIDYPDASTVFIDRSNLLIEFLPGAMIRTPRNHFAFWLRGAGAIEFIRPSFNGEGRVVKDVSVSSAIYIEEGCGRIGIRGGLFEHLGGNSTAWYSAIHGRANTRDIDLDGVQFRNLFHDAVHVIGSLPAGANEARNWTLRHCGVSGTTSWHPNTGNGFHLARVRNARAISCNVTGVARWPFEWFYCPDSTVYDCDVDESVHGISLASYGSQCMNNRIRRLTSPNSIAIELVGQRLKCGGNVVRDIPGEHACGVAVNGDSGIAPPTIAEVFSNEVWNVRFAVQCYHRTRRCHIHHNAFYERLVNGVYGRGVNLVDTGVNAGEHLIERNDFHGQFDGCVYSYGSNRDRILDNTQYASDFPSELPQAPRTNFVYNNGGIFTTDDVTMQSAPGYSHMGTNKRLRP